MNILQKTVSNLVVVFFLFSLKMINGYFSLIISGRIFFLLCRPRTTVVETEKGAYGFQNTW